MRLLISVKNIVQFVAGITAELLSKFVHTTARDLKQVLFAVVLEHTRFDFDEVVRH